MQPITTFAPDANPLTPGILVSADGVYPAETGGLKAVPSLSAMSDALAKACIRCFSYQNHNGSFRTIAGTVNKLYELSVSTWNDVSRTTDYTATTWNFAAWGNYILAVNDHEVIQVQSASLSDFADLSGSPVAKFITAAQNFVIVANVELYGNRVQWSAQGDHTDWTPSLSTESGYVDLGDTPGEITGLAKLGDDILVFKERTLYHGTYIGAPLVWSFRRVQAYCGTPSQDSIIELENGVYFAGLDDFYVYDGSSPKRVGQGIRFWFRNQADSYYMPKITGVYDGLRRLIFWFYPTATDGTGSLVEALIYDWQTQRWGRVVQGIETGLTHWVAAITYDGLASWFATYAILEATAPPYDSSFWGASSFGIAVIGTDHKLSRFNGTPTHATVITGDMGSLQGYSRITKAFPYFDVTPSACRITPMSKTRLGETQVAGSGNFVKTNGEVDLDRTGKFLALKFETTGDFGIIGFDAEVKQVSRY